MKIVIPGGSGQVGTLLARAFVADGHEVVVLSRHEGNAPWRVVRWDAEAVGDWAAELDGADVVINLAGRSVNCRYNAANRRAIRESRESTRGRTRDRQGNLPAAGMAPSEHGDDYAHRYDAPNDEATGILGGTEPDAPDTWRFSIDIAKAWEQAANEADVADSEGPYALGDDHEPGRRRCVRDVFSVLFAAGLVAKRGRRAVCVVDSRSRLHLRRVLAD